ncbi:ribonuclease Z [Rhodothermus profundi]|uniref:Ribonuclease Z n=1 Tax=Rhodothermus profundi TaxID=633813 RepID=A0A1M6QNK0_9BACT|nr:ribonuclease Z [Rhodothermus profundi]SHK21663.1 RNAse Z [Rhodothermus profundi]
MELFIIPLGTASAIPTRTRHLSSVALWRAGRLLLFDCGEGTQYRLLAAHLKSSRLEAIFITHFHGDHFYGLFGLLATLSMVNRTDPLVVVGPEGIGKVIESVPGLSAKERGFPIRYVELAEDVTHAVVFETPEYVVTARPVEHRVFTVGYRFEERMRPGHLDVARAQALGVTDPAQYRALKEGQPVWARNRWVRPEEVVGPPIPGRTFAYLTDTRPCENGRLLAEGVDLLYHEATFGDEHRALAIERGHATAREAAELARAAGAHRLLLGHFSARYEDPSPLVAEARIIFPNTEAAEELKRYAVPLHNPRQASLQETANVTDSRGR